MKRKGSWSSRRTVKRPRVVPRRRRRRWYRRPELKWYTQTLTSAFSNITSTASQMELTSLVTQGDDYTNRDGQIIFVKRLIIKGILTGSGAYNDTVRIMVSLSNGSLAGPTNLLYPYTRQQDNNLLKNYRDRTLLLTAHAIDGETSLTGRKQFKAIIPINKRMKYNAASAYADKRLTISMLSNSLVSGPSVEYGYVKMTFVDS